MTVADGTSTVAISIHRRIEWIDTDAAGIYHWTTACRLTEAAEAALHTALGIVGATFGATPRVNVEFDFKRPLHFNDEVDVRLVVDRLGRSSVRYAVNISGPQGVAVEGSLTACFVDRRSGRPAPWPETARHALATGQPSPSRSAPRA